ncbi:MFS transporter [Gluconacetobacter tumulisoli]|uniref:MFS transporter n=1 Tax=Gluconacetobacter tumulisoli TaxID=1286189 RepID=A0A7W4KAD1_9PROT|nr:MFS transporter [Gluconacetobacter tumulisoli]MBB2203278.1 MFS transporter [Gluconacetobacter tumulisoli]
MNREQRSLFGLAGVIALTFATEMNEQVSAQALPDIAGALGLSRDPQRWFSSLYITAEIVGMSVSPWLAVTLTLRRFSLAVPWLAMLSSSLIPFTGNLTLLYGLRIFQGLSGGFTVPLLMTTALRVLPPPIRLYGLAAYAMTATFFPSLSTTFAGLWTDLVNWRFVFWQSIPLCTISFVLLWYGMPVEPPRHERFWRFDWQGFVLVLVGMGAFSTMLQMGDWMDWFNSPAICVMVLLSVVCIPLFVLNEWFHPLPLFKFQLLKRRNFAYGASTLLIFMIISLSSSTLPADFLRETSGYRPEQIYPVTLEIAATQIVMLPFMAVLLNQKWVDSRIVSFIGMTFILVACIGDFFITSNWVRDQFYLWQAFQGVGNAMIVMPLLMMSTNTLVPEEGPFASAMVNTPRAVAEAVGIWLIQLMHRERGSLHSDRITDRLGQERFQLIQGANPMLQHPAPLMPDGLPASPGGMAALHAQVTRQTATLTYSDDWLVMACIVLFLMIWVSVLPVRTYPPRIVFKSK